MLPVTCGIAHTHYQATPPPPPPHTTAPYMHFHPTHTHTTTTSHHHLPNTPPHAHTFRNALLGIKQLGNAGKMMHTHTFVFLSTTVQLRSLQDGISVHGKAPKCTTMPLRSVPNISFATVPVFVWLTMALSFNIETEHMIFHTALTNPPPPPPIHPMWLGNPWTPLLLCMVLSPSATVP